MKKLFLILIIFLAFFLRFYKLNSYPALNADEAAIGYNAYSLLQTGKDEHGNSWPIHFQSFNDYKPGLYVYIVMPFVAVLGLNEWAVRIPNAALGVLTTLIVYFLVKKLLPISRKYSIFNFQFSIEELAALFIAISPWHIHFSRGGWEVNTATFFITAGLLFFLKGLHSKKYIALSVLAFVMSLYTYHAARIIVPLLGIGLIFFYWRDLWKEKKYVLMSGASGILFIIPLFVDLLGPAGISRAAGVGLFADTGPLNRINEQRGEHHEFKSVSTKLLHNKATNYGLAFLENWTDHYHGEFLFSNGDVIQRNKVPETGQTYLISLVFFLVGIYAIASSSFPRRRESIQINAQNEFRGWKIILWWFLVAPLAAALTFQSPHALRAQNMVVPFEIINALGLYTILTWFKENIKIKSFMLFVYCLLFIALSWSFGRYLHEYYIHMAKEYPFSSQYGVKELVSYLSTPENSNKRVLVTDRYDQPYILFLFYTKYPPAKFQLEHTLTARDQFGFSTVRSFDRYNFWPIDFENARRDYPNSLIVGTDEEIPKEGNIVKKVYGSNGYLYFEVVEN
jgi:4-amino-4-deoxy-L-arabinose transferase-like glycosyltransferase